MKGKILLKNAVAMDPAAGLKNKLDLLIENGRISRLSRNITPLPDCELINAEMRETISGGGTFTGINSLC